MSDHIEPEEATASLKEIFGKASLNVIGPALTSLNTLDFKGARLNNCLSNVTHQLEGVSKVVLEQNKTNEEILQRVRSCGVQSLSEASEHIEQSNSIIFKVTSFVDGLASDFFGGFRPFEYLGIHASSAPPVDAYKVFADAMKDRNLTNEAVLDKLYDLMDSTKQMQDQFAHVEQDRLRIGGLISVVTSVISFGVAWYQLAGTHKMLQEQAVEQEDIKEKLVVWENKFVELKEKTPDQSALQRFIEKVKDADGPQAALNATMQMKLEVVTLNNELLKLQVELSEIQGDIREKRSLAEGRQSLHEGAMFANGFGGAVAAASMLAYGWNPLMFAGLVLQLAATGMHFKGRKDVLKAIEGWDNLIADTNHKAKDLIAELDVCAQIAEALGERKKSLLEQVREEEERDK